MQSASTITHLWNLLTEELAGLQTLGRPWELYGVVWQPARQPVDDPFYMAATAGPVGPATLHSALVTKTLPPLTYARFTHTGPRSDLDLTRGCVYPTWLPQANASVSYPLELEHYGQHPPEPSRDGGRWQFSIPIAYRQTDSVNVTAGASDRGLGPESTFASRGIPSQPSAIKAKECTASGPSPFRSQQGVSR